MRPFARLLQLTCMTALAGAPLVAAAQPGQLTVHDPFYETGRFLARHLVLNGGGNSLVVPRGGRIDATLDVNQRCPGCRGSANQIIVGLAGEPGAQACVWSGGASSNGWQATRFALDVPDVPGLYEVRVRYAQAASCRDATRWWRTDRPQGPTGDATIGIIVVQGDPEPPPPAERPVREIMKDIDAATADLDASADKLQRVAGGRMDRRDKDEVRRLGDRIGDIAKTLAGLHGELDDAVRRALHEDRRDDRPGRHRSPRFERPNIVVVAAPDVDPGPQPLSPSDFSQLVKRIDDAAFPDAQLNALSDAINAGAYFLTRQAVGVMGHFAFDNNKVDAAAMMCPRIVEAGPLPDLLGAMTFESYRGELRKKTNNRCGLRP